MRPDVPDGWQRLTCSCGTERFAPAVNLRWRDGGGVTQEPAGYFCLECHGIVDSRMLIEKAKLKAKRQELLELEAELNGTPAPKEKVAAKK